MIRTLTVCVAGLLLTAASAIAEEHFGAFLESTLGSSSTARAIVSLTLDVNGDALAYSISTEGLDFDGTQTPDPDDDVTAMTFYLLPDGPAVFSLMGPDDDPGADPVINPVAATVAGVWDDGDAHAVSDQVANLRADDLYLGVSTTGSDSAFLTSAIGGFVRKAEAAHWPMDPASSSGSLDGEYGAGGTLVGYPLDGSEWAQGVFGRALEFDGATQHVTHLRELPKSQGTIAHWLRPDAAGLRVAVYESDAPAAGESYNGFGLVADSLEIHTGTFDDEFLAHYQDGTGGLNVPGSGRRQVQGGSVEAGRWSHVAMTWNLLGELRLYVDCEEVQSVNMADGEYSGHAPSDLLIGAPSETIGRNWDGLMDEVEIFAVELTGEQIRSKFCTRRASEHPPFFGVSPQPDFGKAAAMDGEWLALGSINGGVDIFRRTGHMSWTLTHHRAFAPWGFNAISLEGSTLAIGSTGSRVDIYAENQGGIDAWGHVKTLLPPQGDTGDFGRAVHLSGDLLGVGSPDPTSGSVYLYSRNEGGANAWGEIPGTNLGAPYFGYLLTLDQQWAFLPAADPPEILILKSNAGSWSLAGFISGPWTVDDDFDFIWNLAVRDDMLLVGLGGEGLGGAVNVYRDGGDGIGWTFDHRFAPSDVDVGDVFGSRIVWLEDDVVAVAAGADNLGDHSTLYTFQLDENGIWRERTAYLPRYYDSLDERSEGFRSLTGDGDLALAGVAPSLSGNGSMRVFSLPFFFDGFESGDSTAWDAVTP